MQIRTSRTGPGRIVTLVAVGFLALAAVPSAQAWLGGDAHARGLRGRISDALFAKRIAGSYFNAGRVQIGVDGDGNPVYTNRGYTWTFQEDGTYIHEDSGAFESDEFFNFILSPHGVTLEMLGIDIQGVMSTGIGRWERLGPRTAGITIVKYKYSSTGAAVFLFVLKSITEFDDKLEPMSQQFQLTYYNLVDLVNPFAGGLVQPGLTAEELNSIMDPDPANRPQPWFCYTSPPAATTADGTAAGSLLPVDESLSCP